MHAIDIIIIFKLMPMSGGDSTEGYLLKNWCVGDPRQMCVDTIAVPANSIFATPV